MSHEKTIKRRFFKVFYAIIYTEKQKNRRIFCAEKHDKNEFILKLPSGTTQGVVLHRGATTRDIARLYVKCKKLLASQKQKHTAFPGLTFNEHPEVVVP